MMARGPQICTLWRPRHPSIIDRIFGSRFPTRREVDAANQNKLDAIREPEHLYTAKDAPGVDDEGNQLPMAMANEYLKNLVAQKSIVLKAGAQVMLIKVNILACHLR